MEELKTKIEEAMKTFAENMKENVEKGNKAAGLRARKASLELEKLFKEYRKVSVKA